MVRCRHIVLATSVFGPPVVPAIPSTPSFGGEIVHARDFHSVATYVGRRVLVIGGGNTAVDVCQDLVGSGAARVTLLQRSATCVLLKHALAAGYGALFPRGVDTVLIDFRIASVPWRVRVRERLVLKEREDHIERGEDLDVDLDDAERTRKLKDTGFLVNYGRDGRGLTFAILERLGGTFISASRVSYADPSMQAISSTLGSPTCSSAARSTSRHPPSSHTTRKTTPILRMGPVWRSTSSFTRTSLDYVLLSSGCTDVFQNGVSISHRGVVVHLR